MMQTMLIQEMSFFKNEIFAGMRLSICSPVVLTAASLSASQSHHQAKGSFNDLVVRIRRDHAADPDPLLVRILV
jgi:hypothetical protein